MKTTPSDGIADEALFEAPSEKTRAVADHSNELELATVIRVQPDGMAVLKFAEHDESVNAISTVPLDKTSVGRQAAVMYTQSSQPQAVVIGLIRSQLDSLLDVIEVREPETSSADEETESRQHDVSPSYEVDGKRIALTGQEEVVLKCGAASITLTKAGKIVIRGKSLLNRASGVNRILGGSVQIN